MQMVVHAMFQPEMFEPEQMEKMQNVILQSPTVQTLMEHAVMNKVQSMNVEFEKILSGRDETIEELRIQLAEAQKLVAQSAHGPSTVIPNKGAEAVPPTTAPAPTSTPALDVGAIAAQVANILQNSGGTPARAPAQNPLPSGPVMPSGYRPGMVNHANPILGVLNR